MIKDKTIYLEATQDKNRLKIAVYRSGDVIWRYEDIPVPVDNIRMRCHEMMDTLNSASRNGGSILAYEKLRALGRRLCDELLSRDVKEKLAFTAAEYLILNIDDHLVHIPWELLCVDNEFLCHRFNMGRLVKTRQNISLNCKRAIERPLKVWILANPSGDLAVADTEGLQIFQDMARMNENEVIIDPSLDTEISTDDVRENIKGFDFIHFAGHVDYDAQNPVNSGWRLTDGKFTVLDIDKMSGGTPMPSMIFSNACQSARTEIWDNGTANSDVSFGMTNAFLRAGVRHYIGTCWEVMDEPSSIFAHEFYRLLRAGMTTGESVKQARCNLTQEYGPDICWASYILYGDPTVRYFRQDTSEPRKIKDRGKDNIKTISGQNALTRGTLFNYSINTARINEIRNWVTSIVLIIIASSLLIGGVLLSNWIRHEEKNSWNISRFQIQQMMIAKAERQQERAERLFENLTNMTDGLPPVEGQYLDALTIAAVFDSHMIKNSKEKIILHVIQDQIVKSCKAFRLIEQESFDIILEELVHKITLTPPEQRTRPRMLMPKFILILEVYDTGATTLVMMRLVEQETRQILETLFKELDNSMKILDQKENLTKDLLEKIKKYEK